MYIGFVPFIAGFVGILGYVALRLIEVRRGKRFFEPSRQRLDAFSEELYRLAVFGELPTAYRARFRSLIHTASHTLVSGAVALLRAVERPLSRLRHRLRTTRPENGKGHNPSPFIQKMADSGPNGAEKPDDSVS